MKLVITITVFVLITCASSAPQIETFNTVYEDFVASSANPPPQFAKFIKNVDRNCLSEKLNLAENGDKIYQPVLMFPVFYGSFLKCLDAELMDDFLDTLVNHYSERAQNYRSGYVECYQLKLQQVDPNSMLIKNFKKELMQLSEEECNEFMDSADYGIFSDKFERDILNISTFTCGAVDKVEAERLWLDFKTIAVTIEDVETKKAENRKILDIFKSKWERIYECLVNRL